MKNRYLSRHFAVVLLGTGLFAAAPAVFASTKPSYMHYLKALLLQHQGDYSGALKEFDEAAKMDPQATYILEQAAELALETGQPDVALTLAKRLVEADPKNHKSHFLLGNVYWARGETKEAQASFENALKFDPNFSDAMFALGNLLNTQSPDKAKRYFLNYLKTNPDRAAEAHYQIAMVENRQGNVKEAISHLRTAVDLEPTFQHARYSLAQMYEIQKDTDAALTEYREILESEPDNLMLINHIGELYVLKDDAAQAENYFSKAKTLSPNNPGACFWIAVLAEQKGDFARAAQALSESSALAEDAELNLRLSYYLTQANRLKEAMGVLENAHKKWPDSNEIDYFLALGYDDMKETDKAIELLKQVLVKNPSSRDARFQLGALYEKQNKIEDAEREFRALLDQHPADAAALNYLGYSLADRGLKLPEAENMIRRAVAVEPSNGAYHDSLGWVYFKQKKYKEALEELQSSVALMPEDSAVWDHIGEIYQATGDPVKAWKSWKIGLAYDPANDVLPKKISAAESSWSAEILGRHLLEFLGEIHGEISHLGGFCELWGSILGKPIHFTGLVTYKSKPSGDVVASTTNSTAAESGPGDLSLEILGPMFVPMFHVRLEGDDSFSMDSVPWEGGNSAALEDAIHRTFTVMRNYMNGRDFQERRAAYHKGWRTHYISTEKRQLFLDGERNQLTGLKSAGSEPLTMSLDDYHWQDHHALPSFLRLEGKGFSIRMKISEPVVEFNDKITP